jgi:ATP-dependent RNA helicase HelY
VIGEFSVNKILSMLERDNLLPAILFRTARKQCDIDVERIAQSNGMELAFEAQDRLEKEVGLIAEKFGVEREVLTTYPQYQALITTGVGAHHAGQLLIWRLTLEELMTRGLLRLLIATGTVAAGVDFPARTVIITAHSKRGTDGFDVLSAAEFQQMSGRAGRRGKDAVGICLVAPGPYADARVVHAISKSPPEPLRSSYFAAPSTMLNLLKFRNVDDLRFTVSKSLAAFLDWKQAERSREGAEREYARVAEAGNMPADQLKRAEKRHRRSLREADELETKQAMGLDLALSGLQTLGYVDSGKLTEKGYWAAQLCTSLVLELGEAVADHVFADLSVVELVGAVASIAGDSHRSYLSIKRNPIKKDVFRALEQILERVKNAYRNPAGSEITVQPDAATTVITWMEASDWYEFASLLRLAGVAEGDVARLVTQTADHLNQLSRLEDTHPDLARLAADGRRLLLRPPLSEAVEVEAFRASI